MRAITYERILQRLCGLIGIARDDLQTDEAELLNSHINRALSSIWNMTVWPQVVAIEERTPVAGLISFAQSGETVIDAVFAVYDYDPYGSTRATALPYAITDGGIQLTGTRLTSTDEVFVYFRKRCPDLTGSDYATGTAYVADGQAYYPTTGDYYRAKQSTTGNAPTNTTYWERLEVPYDFADFLVHSAYADWLRTEGQNERAIMQANNSAERELAEELDKLERQQGLLPPLIVNTHLAAHSTQ